MRPYHAVNVLQLPDPTSPTIWSLTHGHSTRPILAPPGVETEAGPWTPLGETPGIPGGTFVSPGTTEYYSTYIELEALTPADKSSIDNLDTSVPPGYEDIDTWYPAAYSESSERNGVNQTELYVGITTFGPGAFERDNPPETGVPELAPNEVSVETRSLSEGAKGALSAAAWEINGWYYLGSTTADDTRTAELFDWRLKIAIIPESYLEEAVDDQEYPRSMYKLKARPTQALLDSLFVVETLEFPSRAEFEAAYPVYVYSNGVGWTIQFQHSLTINPGWLNADGRVHFAYWVEAANGDMIVDNYFDQAVVVTSPVPGEEDTRPDGSLGANSATDFISHYGEFSKIGNEYYLSSDATYQAYNGTYSAYYGYYGGAFLNANHGAYNYTTNRYQIANGFVAGNRTMTWTFTSVNTNDFGMCIERVPFNALVVTPTQVLHISRDSYHSQPPGQSSPPYNPGNGSTTIKATHSTPFTSGDVCEVIVTNWTSSSEDYEVRRNGVTVSTFTHVWASVYGNDYTGSRWQSVGQWGMSPNPNNRTTGMVSVAAPTNYGMRYVMAELDYGDNPSVFNATYGASEPSEVEYRINYAKGYPRFRKERWQNTDVALPDHWVCWFELDLETESMFAHMGWLDPRVIPGDDPGYLNGQQGRRPLWMIVYKRDDGFYFKPEEYAYDDYDGSSLQMASHSDRWPFRAFADGHVRGEGVDPIHGSNYGKPYAYGFLNNEGNKIYLRCSIGEINWAAHTGDLTVRRLFQMQFQAYRTTDNRSTNASYWKWQDGDDRHARLGRAHYADRMKALPVGPPRKTEGMALYGETSVYAAQSGTYMSRRTVMGYSDAHGPFFYAHMTPSAGAYHGDDRYEAVYDYDDQAQPIIDQEGRIFTPLQRGVSHWGHDYGTYGENMLYYNEYYDTYYGRGGELRVLGAPGGDSRRVALPVAWQDSKIDFVVQSPSYPQSIFVQTTEYSPSIPYGGVEASRTRLFEVDKITQDIVREMAPFLYPLASDGWQYPGPYTNKFHSNSYIRAAASDTKIYLRMNAHTVTEQLSWITQGMASPTAPSNPAAFAVRDWGSERRYNQDEIPQVENYGWAWRNSANSRITVTGTNPTDVVVNRVLNDDPAFTYYTAVSKLFKVPDNAVWKYGPQPLFRFAVTPQAHSDDPNLQVRFRFVFVNENRDPSPADWITDWSSFYATDVYPSTTGRITVPVTVPVGAYYCEIQMQCVSDTGVASAVRLIQPAFYSAYRTQYEPVTHATTVNHFYSSTQLVSYDLVTETLATQPLVNPPPAGSEMIIGVTDNGSLLAQESSSYFTLTSPSTGLVHYVTVSGYVGKGYQPRCCGTDGKYLYFERSNAHIDAGYYVPPSGQNGMYSEGEIFMEVYRYDLTQAMIEMHDELVTELVVWNSATSETPDRKYSDQYCLYLRRNGVVLINKIEGVYSGSDAPGGTASLTFYLEPVDAPNGSFGIQSSLRYESTGNLAKITQQSQTYVLDPNAISYTAEIYYQYPAARNESQLTEPEYLFNVETHEWYGDSFFHHIEQTYPGFDYWTDATADKSTAYWYMSSGGSATFIPLDYVSPAPILPEGLIRRPPSQRDPEYREGRTERELQSMMPGTMTGFIANASPVPSMRLLSMAQPMIPSVVPETDYANDPASEMQMDVNIGLGDYVSTIDAIQVDTHIGLGDYTTTVDAAQTDTHIGLGDYVTTVDSLQTDTHVGLGDTETSSDSLGADANITEAS